MFYGLRAQREAKGLTQLQLAKLLGVGRTTITELETGEITSLSAPKLLKLKELGFDLGELVTPREPISA